MGIHQTLSCTVVALGLLCAEGTARAQGVEVAPFIGYRVGGGFNEVVTGQPVDVDGARSLGLVLNLPFRGDLQIEGLFTHQEASFVLPATLDAQRTRWRVTVQHLQVGGLRELEPGPIRPFLTGTLGLTRYSARGDDELRFSLAAGGGVKLLPTRHLAVRLDGRLYATIVDADLDTLFCSPGFCVGVGVTVGGIVGGVT